MSPAPTRIDGYAPIRDYAALGNGRTAALVARDGSVDWLALPAFDSSGVFAALLDAHSGGRFTLAPEIPYEAQRRYLPDTNVLETTFDTAEGAVRVVDALLIRDGGPVPTQLVRRVEGLAGSVPMAWRVEPRFQWSGDRPDVSRWGDGAALLRGGRLTLCVQAWDAGELSVSGDAVGARFDAGEGSSALVSLSAFEDEPLLRSTRDLLEQDLDETIGHWRRWIDRCTYDGPWSDAVRRSALALKLLVYTQTGAVAAAATTSLPEAIGGERNWDYRYAWIRDTTFTLDAMMRLGYPHEVQASLAWLLSAARRTQPRLSVFYQLDGGPPTPAVELGLEGYRGSRPVLAGNGAAGQLQLGNYGDLMQTAWLYVDNGNALDRADGARLGDVADFVCRIWGRADSSLWELGDERQYTQGKLAAWLALDRAARLADCGQIPGADPARWRTVAREVLEYIERHCWSSDREAYVRAADDHSGLDAGVLLMARVGYEGATRQRISSTIDALRSELGRGPFLYRYSGMQDKEGAFLACSFWLVDALAHVGRVDEAGELMDELVGTANDVGLFSEEIDPESGEFLGNFPQALTHLTLVSAATALERARSGASLSSA